MMVATRGQTVHVRPDLDITWVHGPGDQTPVTGHPSIIERLVDWKMNDPRYNEEQHMQRQFTMELRVDYADAEKNEVMKTAIKQALRHVFATAVLLADNGIKPQVACFSDDFFAGHEEIKMLDDVIAQGIAETEATLDDGEVSSELMAAARGV